MSETTQQVDSGQLDLGWKWFEFHASQRMSTFKFFLTIYAACGGVALALLERGYAGFGLFAGLLTLYTPNLFWSMDKRSRQLTEIGEAIIETEWRRRGFSSDLNPIQRANKDPTRGGRFKGIFGRLFFFASVFALGVVLWALALLGQQYGLNGAAVFRGTFQNLPSR